MRLAQVALLVLVAVLIYVLCACGAEPAPPSAVGDPYCEVHAGIAAPHGQWVDMTATARFSCPYGGLHQVTVRALNLLAGDQQVGVVIRQAMCGEDVPLDFSLYSVDLPYLVVDAFMHGPYLGPDVWTSPYCSSVEYPWPGDVP